MALTLPVRPRSMLTAPAPGRLASVAAYAAIRGPLAGILATTVTGSARRPGKPANRSSATWRLSLPWGSVRGSPRP